MQSCTTTLAAPRLKSSPKRLVLQISPEEPDAQSALSRQVGAVMPSEGPQADSPSPLGCSLALLP